MIHHQKVRLDLNNPEFQAQWFALAKDRQIRVLASLRKLSEMTWNQIYADRGLKWEVIHSRQGPKGTRLYSFRISQGFRALGVRI